MTEAVTGLICPKCEAPLSTSDKQWRCQENHTYDQAKQGYLNLLLVNHKKSKNPGDDADMVRARTEFLDAGHYQPISDALNSMVSPGRILDIGCGEGYYTERLRESLGAPADITGLDISREAVRAACRRSRLIRWLVASGARPPVEKHSINTVVSLFTPLMPQGLDHALVTDGDIITAHTGPYHLYELRQQIYDDVRLDAFSPVESMNQAGFSCVEEVPVTFRFQLNDSTMINNLLLMTPHRWKVTPDKASALQQLHHLDVRADVILQRFRRTDSI